MHHTLDASTIGILRSRPRRRRMLTLTALSVMSWVMFIGALYLFWLIVT